MNWNKTKVLVTGAGGFIGSHLAERLVQEGAEVTALIHYNALGTRGWLDHSPLAGQMRVLAGDITDAESVRAAMRGAEIVFHLAALIAIPYSYQAPGSYVRTNIEGTLHVLQAAREHGVRRVLHTSTSETYGTARTVPITEAHPLQGQSPYAASKIGADKMAESFHLSFDLPVVTIRPFNTFGPRQSARAIIPTIITQCLAGAREIKLGNLTPTRDLNFVANTVDGYLCAALAQGVEGRTFNLGTGREVSMGDLAGLIARLCGADVSITTETQRLRPEKSEVHRLLADSTSARQVFGWEPLVSLESGLQKTIAWLRDNMGHYQPGTYRV